ncbi:MAG: hypothetical protein IPN76_13495 [Saprospiraceae bacterium]|nr:hypothetical protein [Saprospiraceae bacterium]
MKKTYFQIMAVAIILFATWTFMRNSIWNNPDLYPGEVIMIYARDSSSFFIALRLFFVAMWGWAAYLMWTTGKMVYTWVAVAVYAAFLLIDNLVLGTHYLQFKVENEPWEAAFPMSIFRGIPEAFFTILFNVFAVWTLKKGREKRHQLEEVEYKLNVPA